LFDHLAGLTELSLMWLPLQVVSWSVGMADAAHVGLHQRCRHELGGCVSAYPTSLACQSGTRAEVWPVSGPEEKTMP